MTGPIFYPNTQHENIGDNNVAVPDAYFKVILDYVEPEVKAIGFILENEGSKEQLQNFAVSVDEVEQITQIDFFPLLENEIEDALEASFDVSLWDFDTFSVSKEERIEFQKNKESGSKQEQVIIEEEHTFYNFLVDIMMESKKELRKLFKNLDIEQVFGEIKGIFT